MQKKKKKKKNKSVKSGGQCCAEIMDCVVSLQDSGEVARVKDRRRGGETK